MKRFGYWLISLVLVLGVLLSSCATPQKAAPAPAPEKPSAASPVPGAPQLTREQQLIEGAKKEGEVVLHTMSWFSGPVEKAFAAKYPFLQLKTWDAPTATGLIARLAEEAKIGRYTADLLVIGETDMVGAQDARLLQEYDWSHKGWSGQPSHKYWANIISIAYFPAYNTDLVSPAEAPKSFADLKNPKWRGRAAISTSGRGAPLWTAYVFGEGKVDFEKSESFWREVVANTKPRVMSGYSGPLGMLAAGEYAILLFAASSSATELMWRGAPMAAATLEAAPEHGYSLALLKNSPHPNAAQLLIDFFMSAEGNVVYANSQSSLAKNPDATKITKANLFYRRSGLNLVPMPAEIYTSENTARATKFWATDLHK